MSIGWGTILYGFAAGACAGIGFIFLLIGARRRHFDPLMVSFGGFAVVAAGSTLVTVRLHRASSVDDYNELFTLFEFANLFMIVALFILVAVWTAAIPRWLTFTWTIATTLIGILLVSGDGLLAGEIGQLRTVTLAGEEFVVHVSASSTWRPMLDAYLVGCLALFVVALFRGYRAGHRANATVVSGALIVSLTLGAWDSLVDAARVDTPYLAPFGALIATLGGAAYLAERTVRVDQRLTDQTTWLEELVAERSAALMESNRRLQGELERQQRSASDVALLAEQFEASNALVRSSSTDVDASLATLLDLLTTVVPAAHVELLLDDEQQGNTSSASTWSSSGSSHVAEAAPDLTEPIRVEGRHVGELRAWTSTESSPDRGDRQYLGLAAEHLSGLFHRLELVRGLTDSAVEQERHRIAMDLHDSVTQRMYSVSFLADALVHLADDDPSAVAEPARRVRELVLSSLAELRTLLFELQPETFDETGLDTLVTQLADNAAPTGRPVVTVEAQPAPHLPAEIKVGLYRIAQEALSNACRHSGADQVRVILSERDGVTSLIVSDDGDGFTVDDAAAGHGLANLRSRATTIGVDLDIWSTAGAGTTVEARWLDRPPTAGLTAQLTARAEHA